MKYPTGFALALISVVGCGGAPTPASQAPAPAPSAPEASSPELELVEYVRGGETQHAEVPRVVLLEAGDGELAPLRWTMRQHVYELELELGHRTTGTGAENTTVDDGYAVEARLQLGLGPSDDGETAMIGVRVLEARVAGASRPDHAYANVEAIQGEAVGLIVTTRGLHVGWGVHDGKQPSPLLATLAEQIAEALFVPLPAEPIGVGARWRTRRPVQLSGLVMVEETVFELAAREDKIAVVSATVHRLPLFDESGVIPYAEVDTARTRDAIAALGTQALGDLDRKVDPSVRGKRLVVFAPDAPLYGQFDQLLTLVGKGEVQAPSGTYEIEFQTNDQILLRSPDMKEGEDAPAEPSRSR